jgi:ATP-dependent helicase/nuclease subunit A
VEKPAHAPVGLLRRPGQPPLLVVRHAGEDGPIVTEAQTDLSEDATARAYAERQRLSYVALTRAQQELVIALPARASGGSLAKTVLDLQAEGRFSSIEGARELAVSELLAVPRLELTRGGASVDPPPLPETPPSAAIVLGVTALSDFRICARRFSLIDLLGLPEPRRAAAVPSAEADADPRLAGIAAHRVLELWPLERWGEPPDPAELARILGQGGLDAASLVGQQTLAGLSRFLSGSYAARVRREAVRVERELELTVTLSDSVVATPTRPARASAPRNPRQLELFRHERAPAPSAPAGGSPALVVKATLDLLVELTDGSLHVIDYKRARGGAGAAARYGPQLSLYRSVVEKARGKLPRVGLLNLLGDASEPEWLSPPPLDAAAVAGAFLAARARDAWPGVPEAACRAVHCGFVTSCHFSASG